MSGLFKTSNPALNAKTFENRVPIACEAMTLQGTVNKTGFLLFCAAATAAWTWWLARTQPEAVALCLWGGLIGGLVFALVTSFKKEWAQGKGYSSDGKRGDWFVLHVQMPPPCNGCLNAA
jgi:uncharacterized YccA/Bax inhibitor family protein